MPSEPYWTRPPKTSVREAVREAVGGLEALQDAVDCLEAYQQFRVCPTFYTAFCHDCEYMALTC